MKYIISFFKWLIIVLVVIILGLKLTGNGYLIKGVWATYLHGDKTATITDAKFFDTREITVGNPKPWPISTQYNKKELSDALQQSLEETRSIAFLVVRNDSILHEQYWDGFSAESKTNPFSMTKSIITMLTQAAIQDAMLKGWDQKVIDFLPELQGEFADELTLRHLSTMTAGLEYNEHYTNPFDITARTYYSSDVQKLMLEKVPVTKKPGSFEYQSGATQMLGMVVMRATGKSLSQYTSEKFWQPLGAEHPAIWHLDSKDGTELAFCCYNSNARDFARFGKLMINHGKFDGVQILDSTFTFMAAQPFAVPHYGHGFWIDDSFGTQVFYQRGILGQYIIVIPEKNLVVVRLGHALKPKVDQHSEDFKTIIKEVLSSF